MNNKNGNVYRCPHDSDHPFTIISNELLRENSLSFEALGLLCYLLSHSSGWKTRRSYICNERGIGKDKLKRIFDELIEKGYMKMVFCNDRKGHRQTSYWYSEKPKFKKILPQAGFPPPVKPHPENPPTKERTSKRITSIKNNPPLTPPLKNCEKKEKKCEKKEEDSFCREKKLYDVKKRWYNEKRNPLACERAFKEYERQPKGSVKNISSWLEAVYKQKLESLDSDSLAEHRKNHLHKFPNIGIVQGNYAYFHSGALERKCSLRGNDDIWKTLGLSMKHYHEHIRNNKN